MIIIGAIPYVRVFDGVIKAGMKAKFFAHDKEYEITETGYFVLDKIKTKQLKVEKLVMLLQALETWLI